MARVKLGFARLSVADKILTARAVVNKMTGNPAYPTPQPDLSAVTDATNALELAAQEALKGGTDKTLAKHIAESVLNELMSALVDYVQVASKGEPLTIESSGMEIRKERTPATKPTAVQDARANVGGNAGEINLFWGSVSGVKSYVVEMKLPAGKSSTSDPIPEPIEGEGTSVLTESTTATLEWIRLDTVTKRKLTVKGLNTGTVYTFRMAAINAAGQGDYSQTVSSVAP